MFQAPNNQSQEPNNDPNAANAQPKQKQSSNFKPQQLQAGLQSLYEASTHLDLSQEDSMRSLKKIVQCYKAWHYEVCPRYSYDYFLQRCHALGSHKAVSSQLSKMRLIHKGLNQQSDDPRLQNQLAGNQGRQVYDSNMEDIWFGGHTEVSNLPKNQYDATNKLVVERSSLHEKAVNSINNNGHMTTSNKPQSSIAPKKTQTMNSNQPEDEDEDYMELFRKMAQAAPKATVQENDDLPPEQYIPAGYEPTYGSDDER